MYLKRLEVQGFKSFAERTEFDFNSGITAIVGPNGAGKSNVADAILWVLGEHSYRSLRAREVEDLIFAGTRARTRLGMAEANITFDNSSGWLPIPYSEVTITRRAHRSGENEYLLNGTKVLRREIIELVTEARVGAHSIIGQGLVDQALSMRPEERLAFFEEVAGISIYQSKRDSALKKLEDTESNLVRVADIVAEITPRLEILKRQSERAEEQETIAQELEQNLTTWYGYRWQLTDKAIDEAEAKRKAKEEELLRLKHRLTLLSQGEQVDSRREALERDLESWRRERATLQERKTTLLRDLAVREERLRLLAQHETDLADEASSLKEREGGHIQKTTEMEAEIRRLTEEEANLTARLRTREYSYEEGLSQARGVAFEMAGKLAQTRALLGQGQNRRAELLKEQRGHQEALTQLRKEMQESNRDVARLEEERESLQREADGVRHDIEDQQAPLQASLLRQRELKSRLEGIPEDVTKPSSPSLKYKGVLGTPMSLIKIPSHLKTAMGAALGFLSEGLVVETWDEALKTLAKAEHDLVLLPLESLRPKQIEAPRGRGILGLASELVEGDIRLRQALLGTTLVVANLAAARRLSQDLDGFQLVTAKGELLTPEGALVRRASEPLSRKRLENMLSQESKDYQKRLAETGTLEDKRKKTEARLKDVERNLEEHRRHLDRKTQEIEWRKNIEERLQSEIEDLRIKEQELDGDLKESMAEEERVRGELVALQEGEGASLATQRAVLEERRKRTEAAVKGRRDELHQLQREITSKDARLERLKQERESLGTEIDDLNVKSEALTKDMASLEERIPPLEDELKEILESQRRGEKEEARIRDEIHRLEMEQSQATSEAERAQERLSSLRNQFQVDLENIAPPSSQQTALDIEAIPLAPVHEIPEDLEARIRRLRQRLRRMGPVNPEAPAEYEEVSARYNFITSQAEDLEKAAASLKEIILEMNRLMEERFRSTFHAVAREFEKYFTLLFNGGRGKLSLTEPRDQGKAGVEIITQPPGKRRQNINLLSGGERALTGVALIFAILKATATPFCLLDEVDATLDEINIGRFVSYLKELAAKTQMVIITHNRYTVEAAQSIYGVSLEEGASKVLSLRLEEVDLRR